jgi:hypothetical protein
MFISTNMRRFPSLVSNGNLVTSHLFCQTVTSPKTPGPCKAYCTSMPP